MPHQGSLPSRRQTRGFTLVEALVSITIAAVASSALFMGVASSLQSTQAALEQTIALGMAEQLIDEAMGNLYAAPGAGPVQTVPGPSSYELAGNGRERYNDIDDYHGFSAQPPEDIEGIELATDDGLGGTRHANFAGPTDYFDDWKQETEVYYVDESDPTVRLSAGQTSYLRAVEVRILIDSGGGVMRELVRLRRVLGYVPEP